MTRITLSQANAIVEGTFAKASELGLKPLGVAVLDPGGHLIAFQRQDGASSLRLQIAQAKAGGALALGVSSRKIGDMAVDRPTFVAAASGIAPTGIVPAAGGVIVTDEAGAFLGAVGVTGDTSDNDELAALAGLKHAGLRSQES